MDDKLEITVEKTIEALDRIGRFIDKYLEQLDKKQIKKISLKLQKIKDKVER